MSDTLIADAQAFLADLSANNTRDWWQMHKDRYESDLKAPAEALLAALTPKLAALADAPVTPKLFRPYRDVRFSRDKTPYATWLRMLWAVDLPGGLQPAFYFGIDPDGARAGGGVMAFGTAALDDWRQMLDLDGARIAGVLDELGTAGFRHLSGPALKRVPSPYPADHPQADLLRHKGLAMMRDVPPDRGSEEELMQTFNKIQRLMGLISSIA